MVEYFWHSLIPVIIPLIIFSAILLQLFIMSKFKPLSALASIGIPFIYASILLLFFGFNLINESEHNFKELNKLCSENIYVGSTYENEYCLVSPDYAIPVRIDSNGIMRKIAR